jgi:hypothetical protein
MLKSTICPFCGYPHLAIYEDATGVCQVYCGFCRAWGPQAYSKEHAALEWEQAFRSKKED